MREAARAVLCCGHCTEGVGHTAMCSPAQPKCVMPLRGQAIHIVMCCPARPECVMSVRGHPRACMRVRAGAMYVSFTMRAYACEQMPCIIAIKSITPGPGHWIVPGQVLTGKPPPGPGSRCHVVHLDASCIWACSTSCVCACSTSCVCMCST